MYNKLIMNSSQCKYLVVLQDMYFIVWIRIVYYLAAYFMFSVTYSFMNFNSISRQIKMFFV